MLEICWEDEISNTEMMLARIKAIQYSIIWVLSFFFLHMLKKMGREASIYRLKISEHTLPTTIKVLVWRKIFDKLLKIFLILDRHLWNTDTNTL